MQLLLHAYLSETYNNYKMTIGSNRYVMLNKLIIFCEFLKSLKIVVIIMLCINRNIYIYIYIYNRNIHLDTIIKMYVDDWVL